MKKNIWILVLLSGFLWFCTSTGKKEKETMQKRQNVSVKIPEFNADSAYWYVKSQLDFGPRVPNTSAHLKCAHFLAGKMKEFTPRVIVQEAKVKAYNGTMLNMKNIIGSFGPEGNNRILLAAHWDSRPYADHDPDPANRKKPIDGANDGASGVGVLLEVARQLHREQPPVGVDIIFFDAEDYGPPQDMQTNENAEEWGLGSQYWAKNPHTPGYFAKYGILLDMVGAPNATFRMEGISLDYAPAIVKKVWDIGNQIGFSSYFLYERGGYITDDHLFVIKYRNLPMIDIIHLDKSSETGFYPYWHTLRDNIDAIDKNTLDAVGQTLLAVIYREN